MEKDFPNPVCEKLGKKGENFSAMHRLIRMFQAWVWGSDHSVVALQPYIN
ncbi:hypothetical protein ADIS_0239 [Lunatimonas lonarensis]|uniref:Uncharacterized protein n=1 Tax=Lunatimonas lonarensis TaxID=1232681 RepID=R7ZYV3_9BACT|nr:hypothetical protein ADIS_0239 [Lunatimonas lonarensis]